LHPNSAAAIWLLQVLNLRAAPGGHMKITPERPAWRCVCDQPMHVVRRRMPPLQAGNAPNLPPVNPPALQGKPPDKPDAEHAHTMH
jgi:hypothetical protein